MSLFPAQILFRYAASRILFWFLSFFGIAAILIVLLDSLELVRRSASRSDVDASTIAVMALLHLPHLIETALPFAMLFAGMAFFWHQSRHNEIAICRSAGMSIWQLISPGLTVALVFGLLKIFMLNPLSAVSLTIFENYEVEYFGKPPANLSLEGAGIWIKDTIDEKEAIVHSPSFISKDSGFRYLTVFLFEGGAFHSRIEAASGLLGEEVWKLHDVEIYGPGDTRNSVPVLELPTRLSWESLEESFAAPSSIPIWRLPSFISLLEEAGFSATSHRVQFHATLASPVVMASMVLIAAAAALRPPRRGGSLVLIVIAAAVALGIFLLMQVFVRLGLSGQLPPMLAAWGPALSIVMLGVAWLLYTEDG